MTLPRPLRAVSATAVLAVLASSGCTLAPPRTTTTTSGNQVTLAEARAAVNHHWDVNRQALRATSAAAARTLIDQVETGDALRLDEATIMQEADVRGTTHAARPSIPDSTGVRVFVPRQAGYPAVFLSIRTQVDTDLAGAPTGKKSQVLEYFRRDAAGAPWKNAAYADVADPLASKLDIALDGQGFAAFADGSPGGSQLSTIYTQYVSSILGGHAGQANSRVAAGPLTDQYVSRLQKTLNLEPTVRSVATFSVANQQEGIKLKTTGGGRFVLFTNLFDVVATPAGSGCISGGTTSPNPGTFQSLTDHQLQDIGAVVAAGAEGTITIVAESENSVGIDTRPCQGTTTV